MPQAVRYAKSTELERAYAPPPPLPRLSLERPPQGDEAIHIDSFIEASMARAGPVAKYSRIAGTFFGVSDVEWRRVYTQATF